MILTLADIVGLLEVEPEQFICKAYESFIGRPPDVSGVIHYADRCNSGFPRLAILSELYVANEEQANIAVLFSKDSRKIFDRCRFVCNLPIGKIRWWLLPRVQSNRMSDNKFNWLAWASDYIEKFFCLPGRLADQPAVGREEFNSQIDSMRYLEQKMEALLFDVQKLKESRAQDPEHSNQLFVPEPIDLRSVSYEARQALFNLYSALS